MTDTRNAQSDMTDEVLNRKSHRLNSRRSLTFTSETNYVISYVIAGI